MYDIEDDDDIIKSWKISNKRLSYIAHTSTAILQFLDNHFLKRHREGYLWNVEGNNVLVCMFGRGSDLYSYCRLAPMPDSGASVLLVLC
jgi:hypothetical protein